MNNLEKVVLLATDRKNAPQRIKEISSALSIGFYSPNDDIPLEIKEKFYKDGNLKKIFENNHEFDAYIAAFFALRRYKKVIEKARRISENEKEFVQLLKEFFKNRGLEPITIKYRNISDNEKNVKKVRKRSIKEKLDKNYSFYIKVIRKIVNENVDEKLKLYRDIIRLLNSINRLSIYYVNRENLVAKVSFLRKNNITKYKDVFLDEDSKENIDFVKYVLKYDNLYIKEEYLKYFNDKKVFVVKDYDDLINFILVKDFYENKRSEEKDEYEEIRRRIIEFIRRYREP